jgi:hypothetical protein
MKFPEQWDEGTCGLYALKHCAYLFGKKRMTVKKLKKLSGLSNKAIKKDGVGEEEICEIAEKLGYHTQLTYFREYNAVMLLNHFCSVLEQKGLIITAWHEWMGPHYHWVTVASIESDRVTVIDSCAELEDKPKLWLASDDEPSVGLMPIPAFLGQCKQRPAKTDEDSNVVISIFKS